MQDSKRFDITIFSGGHMMTWENQSLTLDLVLELSYEFSSVEQDIRFKVTCSDTRKDLDSTILFELAKSTYEQRTGKK